MWIFYFGQFDGLRLILTAVDDFAEKDIEFLAAIAIQSASKAPNEREHEETLNPQGNLS